MRILNAVNGIEYGIAEEDDLDAMGGLLADAFCRHEPMAVAVGLPQSQLHRIVAAFSPKVLSEQLSVVARDPMTGGLVGALLTDDFGTPQPAGLDELAPQFAPVGALLDGLDEQYRANRSIQPGTHLHLFMVGVANSSTSRGIAGNLITTCMTNGKQSRYSTAVTEATGSASQHVFRKHGFEDLYLASYEQFVFNDRHVFASVVEPAGAVLMARDL